MRKINEIIIHCSDTFYDMDIGVDEIRRWHTAKGWNDIGYHYVVRRNGTIEKGRKDNVIGAHCRGHNKISIGVCFVGGKRGNGMGMNNFTNIQMVKGLVLITELTDKYPDVSIHGHNEFSKKKCPVFDIKLVIPYE